MLVHKATTASTFVPTTVPRTSASVGRGSCWMPTRAPAHVSRLLLIQISYCLIRPMHTNQKGLGRQMGCKIIQRCCFRVSIKRHLLKTIASQPCFQRFQRISVPKDTTASKSASTTSTRTLASAERDSCWTQTRELVHVSSSWLIFGLQETI